MHEHDGLMVGMFWGGLLVAAVPILLTLGIGIHVLLRWRASREGAGGEGAVRAGEEAP
jgi:hypothetical protein